MSYRISILPPEHRSLFADMTFPAYRSALLSGPSLALGARKVEKAAVPPGEKRGEPPVALALCGPGNSPGEAELLSLFTELPYRADGLATAMLERMENILAQKGATHITTTWNDAMAGAPAFSRVLAKRGWSEPVERMLIMNAEITGRFGEGIRHDGPRYETTDCLPKRYSLIPWTDMTDIQRAFIRSRQDQPGWHTANDDPFREMDILDPELSRLLLLDGEIVGWLTVHRTFEDTARFTDVFLREDLKRAGAIAVAVVIHGFWLLMKARIPKLTWAIRSDNQALYAMCVKRLGRHADLNRTWGAYKSLVVEM